MRVKKDLEGITDDLKGVIARLSKYKKTRTGSRLHLEIAKLCDHLYEGVEVLEELLAKMED